MIIKKQSLIIIGFYYVKIKKKTKTKNYIKKMLIFQFQIIYTILNLFPFFTIILLVMTFIFNKPVRLHQSPQLLAYIATIDLLAHFSVQLELMLQLTNSLLSILDQLFQILVSQLFAHSTLPGAHSASL